MQNYSARGECRGASADRHREKSPALCRTRSSFLVMQAFLNSRLDGIEHFSDTSHGLGDGCAKFPVRRIPNELHLNEHFSQRVVYCLKLLSQIFRHENTIQDEII